MPCNAPVNKTYNEGSGLVCPSKGKDCDPVCDDAVNSAILVENGSISVSSHHKTDNASFGPSGCAQGVDAKEEKIQSDEVCLQTSSERYELWHQRLGHLSPQVMKQSLEAVSGVDLKPIDCNHGIRCVCASCRISKASTLKFSKMPRKRAEGVGHRIHSDLNGPMRTKSVHGNRYAVCFIDDNCGYTWLRFLKSKDEWFDAFVKLYARLKRQFNIRVKVFRCDGEQIFMSHKFTNWLRKRGMRRESTTRATSQLNGRAERVWRTLVNLARSMLSGAGMADRYWDHAMDFAAYILNRVVRSGQNMTPFEALTGEKPDLSNLKVFGCAGYAKVPDALRHKWSPKARKVIFIGLDPEKIGFRVRGHAPYFRIEKCDF